jgi:hypothetical protein
MLQAGRSQVLARCEELMFPIYLILPVALGPEVYSASNINEYLKQKKRFLDNKARPVRKADDLSAICKPIV